MPRGGVVLIHTGRWAREDATETARSCASTSSRAPSPPSTRRALGPEPLVLGADELRDALCARLHRDLAARSAIDAATCARAKALVHLSVAAALEIGSEASREPSRPTTPERQLRPVLRYIDAHLDEPLENARLAAFVTRERVALHPALPARGRLHARAPRAGAALCAHAAELLARSNLTIDEDPPSAAASRTDSTLSRVFAQRMVEPTRRPVPDDSTLRRRTELQNAPATWSPFGFSETLGYFYRVGAESDTGVETPADPPEKWAVNGHKSSGDRHRLYGTIARSIPTTVPPEIHSEGVTTVSLRMTSHGVASDHGAFWEGRRE